MNQNERQSGNQNLNYQNNKLTLQRSVSPYYKLISFNNLSSNSKVLLSMRAKDNTTILDALIYLEQHHQNKFKIILYHKNNPIDVNQNTYIIPLLQKLKIQQLDYNTIIKNVSDQDDELPSDSNDESPALNNKLKGKDSSAWGINIQSRNQQSVNKDKNQVVNEEFLESCYQKRLNNNDSSTFSAEVNAQNNNGKNANYYQNINQSDITVKNIKCQCQQTYNSLELKQILMISLQQKQLAKCLKCNKIISYQMYKNVKLFEKEYHLFKLSLEMEHLKNKFIQNNKKILKCQYCNFFCIWDKNQPQNGFCPNCIQNTIIYEKR